MIDLIIPPYRVQTMLDGLPAAYAEMRAGAKLAEELDLKKDGTLFFAAVGSPEDGWPFLVIAQRYDPQSVSGFTPGLILVPETNVLMIGAGSRLLAYDLRAPRRLWEDETDCGFWSWSRHGDWILMHAELELAGFTLQGEKRWTAFADPPWGCEVRQGEVTLTDFSGARRFPIETGPPPPSRQGDATG